jgi:hypothetical protein
MSSSRPVAISGDSSQYLTCYIKVATCTRVCAFMLPMPDRCRSVIRRIGGFISNISLYFVRDVELPKAPACSRYKEAEAPRVLCRLQDLFTPIETTSITQRAHN